jgi:polyisoprenoid-binding protein YceI
MNESLNKFKLVLAAAALVLVASDTFADTYTIEPTHTHAYFKVNHLGRGNLTGVFPEVKGTFQVDGEHEANAKVDVTIDATKLVTFDKKRDDHLLGPDFFNVKKFKNITFKSTKVTKVSAKEYSVVGDLTIKGKTKSIEAKIERGETGKDPWGGYRTGGNVYFTIDRRDFGIDFLPEPAIGHLITVDLYFEGLRK